jgi:hypothetical protein
VWEFDGKRYSQVGMNAVAGRRPETVTLEPFRFEDMRRGCWDIDARIADMDINGVWASVNFPSQITGFCGRVFSSAPTPSWAWPVSGPGTTGSTRSGGSPIPTASSPAASPSWPTRSSGRPRSGATPSAGFRSVTLPSGPTRSGCPACGTGLLGPDHRRLRRDRHRGLPPRRQSSGMPDMPAGRPLVAAAGGHAVRPDVALGLRRVAVVGLPVRFPGHQDRHERGRHRLGGHAARPARQHRDRSGYGRDYDPSGLRPAEVLARNFWFCTIDDPSTIDTRHRIGVDHIMVEVDYPTATRPGPTPRTSSALLGPPSRRRAAQAARERRRALPPPLPTTVLPR